MKKFFFAPSESLTLRHLLLITVIMGALEDVITNHFLHRNQTGMHSNGDIMRKDRKLVIGGIVISYLEISKDSNWAAWGHFLEHPVTEKIQC